MLPPLVTQSLPTGLCSSRSISGSAARAGRAPGNNSPRLIKIRTIRSARCSIVLLPFSRVLKRVPLSLLPIDILLPPRWSTPGAGLGWTASLSHAHHLLSHAHHLPSGKASAAAPRLPETGAEPHPRATDRDRRRALVPHRLTRPGSAYWRCRDLRLAKTPGYWPHGW